MNCVQRLNGNLHQFAPSFHHFVNFSSCLVDNSAPFSWNSKTFDAFIFILIVEPALGNLHSLTNICTNGVFRINNCPRVALENENWSGTIPKAIKERLKWNSVPNLRELVNFFKGVVDLFLILTDINLLRLLKRIKVMRKFQSA